jgi:hypothetical protein
MAKIKLGAIVTDMSGKLGGHVFSKNKGGKYMRTKSTPSNPQSSAQMSIRGIFASISSAWSALTESSRLSFNGFVSAYATTDIFGDLRNPSGKNLFQRLNQNLSLTGQTLIDTCVAPESVPFANVDKATGNGALSSLALVYNGDTTGSRMLVFATPSLSQGTRFVKNKLRVIGAFDGSVGGSLDIAGDYVAKFGAIVGGSNVVIGVKVINANGQASPMETIKAVIS